MMLLRAFKNKFVVLVMMLGVVGGLTGFAVISNLTDKSSGQTLSLADCQGTCVSLTKGGIKPDEVTVKVGEYVQFNTADGQMHNLALGDGTGGEHGHDAALHDHNSTFISGDFGPGEAWRVQFKDAGTYTFHDHYNPNHRILVVAYNSSE